MTRNKAGEAESPGRSWVVTHWGALSFRDSGAGQQCDRRSTSGRPCGLQSVGWIGVGGSGRPGEKRLGFQPEFWEGRCRPAGPTSSHPPGAVPPPPTEGPRQLCLPNRLPAQPQTHGPLASFLPPRWHLTHIL